MSTNGPAHEKPGTEVQGLRREVQQMTQESQASFMDDMKNMLAEITRSNGQSDSGGAEGSVSSGESPAGAGPARDAGMETIWRDGDSRIWEHWDG